MAKSAKSAKSLPIVQPSADTPNWFPLDNAATIYPACRTRDWNNVYRFAVVFKEEINPKVLQEAVDDFYNRLPTYFVRLRTGAFWYYFERVKSSKVVVEEDYYPCRAINLFSSDEPCFRVMYYKRRLSLEVFHGVADGGSSLIFIKSIAARYLQRMGYDVEISGDLLGYNDVPKPYEQEDSFKKYAVKMKGLKRNEPTSYQYHANAIPNYYKIVHGLFPVEDIKALSKEKGITITEYLAALLLYSFYLDSPKTNKKPIKISVPISLRNSFESGSLRNFSLFTNIGFDPTSKENFTFEDILEEIQGKIKEGLEKDALLKGICKNVGDASNPFVRFLPNGLKRQALNFGFKYVGQNKFAASFTNLGVAKFPPSVMEHIDRIEVLLGETPVKNMGIALVSNGPMMNMTFSGNTKKTEVQRIFFSELAKRGVRIRVECNDKESWVK